MLRNVSADDPRFRTVVFRPGLNLLVADRTAESTDEQSRNAVGKTSVVELLHFLLGARKIPLVEHKELKQRTFRLRLDWPGRPEPLSVRRSGAEPNDVYLPSNVVGGESADAFDFDDVVERKVPVKEWRGAIERDLFRIRPDDERLSGRTLLSLYMRRSEHGGFEDALRPISQASRHHVTTNLCYLLGMDWSLVGRYADISEREQTRQKLNKAAKDPAWDKIVGTSGDLQGRLGAVEQRIGELERQIAEFRVVPEYEEIQRRADELDARIRELRDSEALDRRNLADIESAVADVSEPDDHYLEEAYSELGVLLGE